MSPTQVIGLALTVFAGIAWVLCCLAQDLEYHPDQWLQTLERKK